MIRSIALAAPMLALLAGCSQENPAETPPPPLAEDACGAGKVSRFLGQALTPSIEAEIAADTPGSQRVIRPGDAVTMDFRADRLNIELDAAGKIAKLRCG